MSVCVGRLAAALEATRRLGCELKAVIELRQQVAQLESTRSASVIPIGSRRRDPQ